MHCLSSSNKDVVVTSLFSLLLVLFWVPSCCSLQSKWMDCKLWWWKENVLKQVRACKAFADLHLPYVHWILVQWCKHNVSIAKQNQLSSHSSLTTATAFIQVASQDIIQSSQPTFQTQIASPPVVRSSPNIVAKTFLWWSRGERASKTNVPAYVPLLTLNLQQLLWVLSHVCWGQLWRRDILLQFVFRRFHRPCFVLRSCAFLKSHCGWNCTKEWCIQEVPMELFDHLLHCHG